MIGLFALEYFDTMQKSRKNYLGLQVDEIALSYLIHRFGSEIRRVNLDSSCHDAETT